MRQKWLLGLGLVPALAFAGLFLSRQSLAARMSQSVSFTHGVASGDVTPFSAVLWTRVNGKAMLTVEVSTDPMFQMKSFEQAGLASAHTDFTVKVIAAPLRPNVTYFYRWRHDSTLSEVGTFKTPPLRFAPADVRFAYSGDSDGTRVNGIPFFNNFEALDAARNEDLDFFVYLGDTIYADSGLRATGPAMTLDEYRDTYKVNREMDALRGLMRATSIYAIWDDHEVHDDFDGQTVAPTLYANGRRAFLEYMPVLSLNLRDFPGCGGVPLFRVFHWGKDVDVIILDERSRRSPDVEDACGSDLAPTLPSLVRTQFGLSPAPPSGCLKALLDPSRTLLGTFQKSLFKVFLLFSKAKFKFVINEVPIQQFYALPYDRWEGYAAERAEILNFIRDQQIRNVVFLSTDTHANLINEVFIDRFTEAQPIADEFVTGPIATFTFEQEIRRAVPIGLDPNAVLGALHALFDIVGVNCRHLNAFSYGLVNVDASAGTANITLKDDRGAALVDQLNPATSCAKTIGP
jgi:alkaline phosphatase D